MDLPHANKAIVESKKVIGYLLNPRHPEGASKAAFFHELGFGPEDWRVLADELRQLATRSTEISCMESQHGRKYIVDGAISGRDGKSAWIRTIWIVDTEQTIPRLVTAYPRKMVSNDDQ